MEIKVISDEERMSKLDALSLLIAEKRKDAVEARENSGIEDTWMACEEAYLGIDDANRHEYRDAKWAKPTSMQGPLVSESVYKDNSRSTAYVRLTSRYVDAGAAKLAEILLPIDDKPFSFSATPIADLIANVDKEVPMVAPNGAPIMKPVAAAVGQVAGQPPQAPVQAGPVPPQVGAMPPQPGMPQGAPPMQQATLGDLAAAEQEKAQESAEKAEKRIYDWMVEANYNAENRKVIFDSARIGVGILKGPFPDVRRNMAAKKTENGMAVEIVEKIKPSYKWVDPWDIFPDGACGENIHDGDHLFERDRLSASRLKKLKRQQGYLKDQIDAVLEEGPERCFVEDDDDKQNPNLPNLNERRKKLYQVWYFYGMLTRKELVAANVMDEEIMPEGSDLYVIVTMVNDRVIKAAINPLESGEFPFHAMPWSRRAGYWAGVGIAEQVSMPQRMLNAATRALLNNAGNSCGPQLIIDRSAITPAQANNWTIHPNKIWFKEPDSQIPDVRAAFMSVEIPNVGPQMMAIVEYAFKLAEESSNIPLVTQGQTGPTTPETLGAVQLQYNNAHTLLRSIGHSFDDHITEPIVRKSYEWLLLDPEVPDDEKGDWEINAHGSDSLVERAIQDQTLALVVQMSLNPTYGANPKKVFQEFMKSKRIDPRRLSYTEEEQEKIAQTPPPEPPQIAAAKIRADADVQIEQMKLQGSAQTVQNAPQGAPDTSLQAAQIRAQTELQKAQMANQFAMQELQAKNDEAERQRQHELQMRQIDLQIKQLEIGAKSAEQDKQIAAGQQERLDQSKVELAKTTITENTKRELAEQETNLALTLDQASKNHEAVMNPPSLIRDEMSTGETP